VTDILDEAQAIEELWRAAAISRARARPRDQSEDFCVRCGTTIPEARRAAAPGCKHCIGCRQELEDQRT
jgi:phage/conjugal plasmid C-4 type zinc finger TraR family protein